MPPFSSLLYWTPLDADGDDGDEEDEEDDTIIIRPLNRQSNILVHSRMHVRADRRCIKHNCSKSILIETKEIRAKMLSSSFHCYYHYYHLTHLRRVEHSCSHSMITLSTSTAACMVLCMVFEGVEGQRRIVIVRIYLTLSFESIKTSLLSSLPSPFSSSS
jgi:hypothetical protein